MRVLEKNYITIYMYVNITIYNIFSIDILNKNLPSNRIFVKKYLSKNSDILISYRFRQRFVISLEFSPKTRQTCGRKS